jgi:hypothetical protein
VKVPVNPNEDLLNEILRLLAVTNRAIYEVQEACLIPFHQLGERSFLTPKERGDDG